METKLRKELYTSQCKTCRQNNCKGIDCYYCNCLYEKDNIECEFECHCFDILPIDTINILHECEFYTEK